MFNFRSQYLACLTVIALLGSYSAADDLLLNGDFETGDLSNWTDPSDTGPTVPNATLGAPAAGAQDGSVACQLALASGVSELRQTFPAAPGQEFRLEGWMLTESPLPMGDSFGLFKIVFQDENGIDLEPASVSEGMANASGFPGVESLPFMDSTQADGVWLNSVAEGVAPAGTVQVLFLALNVDFADGNQNPIWFDNINAQNTADGINLLENPSFETGDFTGWFEPPSSTPDNASLGAPGVGAQDGSVAMLFSFFGNGVGEVRQTFPAAPGDEFNFSGYMLTEPGLPFGATFGLYKIVFQDENGMDLEPASVSIGQFAPPENPGVESQPFLDSSSPLNTWIFSEAQGVAPAGTTQVVFLALNIDFANGLDNPMWFDNLNANNTADGINLLENPSFETNDFTGWIDIPDTGGNGSVGAPGVGAKAGAFAAKLENESAVGELRQSFPANPGEEFNLQGFMLSEAMLPGGPSFGLYKIVFRDAMGNDLEPASVSAGQFAPPENPGVESTPFLNELSMVNTWQFSEAQGVAPAGTVEVLFLCLNIDFGGGNNPIWFDCVQGCLVEDTGCDFDIGDVNQDGDVNLLDVAPFVDLLSNNMFQCEADINGDGTVNLLDVSPFVALLSGGP